jgi:serine/threonine-protein kinase TTK/MPS1
MLFELGNGDLSDLLRRQREALRQRQFTELQRTQPDAEWDPEAPVWLDSITVRDYFRQMVSCVRVCHVMKLLHLDLKPQNFVLVHGRLKLIDFGIATQVKSSETTSVIREENAGTINYMAPESLESGSDNGAVKVSRAADVWALGCILYQMVYGHTPFAMLRGVPRKIRAITSPTHQIEFPDVPRSYAGVIDVMRMCLNRDPALRPTVDQLLVHPYLSLEGVSVAPPPAVASGPVSHFVVRELLEALHGYGALRIPAGTTPDQLLATLHERINRVVEGAAGRGV